MSPTSRRKRGRPAGGGAKAPSLCDRVGQIESYLKDNAHDSPYRIVDGPLVEALRKPTSLGNTLGTAVGPPKTSSFPESLDVISSDLARLQNLPEAINNRLYGDGSPTTDAAATPAPYSVSDKTTTIRSQANHCMNFAESILNRF